MRYFTYLGAAMWIVTAVAYAQPQTPARTPQMNQDLPMTLSEANNGSAAKNMEAEEDFPPADEKSWESKSYASNSNGDADVIDVVPDSTNADEPDGEYYE